MAKALISSPASFVGVHGLQSLTRRCLHTLPQRRLISTRANFSFNVLKDGLSAVHVPYAYGFAIILLTVVVKIATLPLTKQQVESTLAMQNLQPKIKAIQERYARNQDTDVLDEAYASSNGKPVPDYSGPKRSKRSKRKRVVIIASMIISQFFHYFPPECLNHAIGMRFRDPFMHNH